MASKNLVGPGHPRPSASHWATGIQAGGHPTTQFFLKEKCI